MAGDNLKYMHASDPLAISAKAWNEIGRAHV